MNILNLICHRKPERSFFIRNHQFPVCARCTGFYISVFLYFIYVYFFYVDYTPFLIMVAIFLLLPAFIDGSTQLLGYRESNNILRLVTGLMGGLGLGILIKAFKYLVLSYFGGV